MEEQLLIAGQARYAYTAKSALVERLWRIIEMPAAEVGLATVPGCVENHRVNVDPTAALSDQLNTNRSPINFHAVASPPQSAQRHRLVAGVQRQVEVTVQPRLPTNQSVDTPTAGDPNRAAGLGHGGQYPQHLTKIHALACSVGPLKPALIAQHGRHWVLREGQRS
jgi:hypothetical protein